ncbi:MAG: SMC-Scp complex subunit ScpB [Nanoarchaeota archaeon]
MSDASKQVEALLFSSGKWMAEDQLAMLTNMPKDGVKSALQELKTQYEQADSSLTLMNESDGWKLNVRENYLELVRKIIADAELPRPWLQTLSVIAWKRPVLQSEVVQIRSDSAYEHIGELEKRGFILKEPEGRSYLLKLTPKFFEYFDVKTDEDMKKVFEHIKIPEIPLQPLQGTEAVDPNYEDIIERLEEVKKSIPPPEPVKMEEMQGFDDELEALHKRVDSHSEELKQFRRIENEPTPVEPAPTQELPEQEIPPS